MKYSLLRFPAFIILFLISNWTFVLETKAQFTINESFLTNIVGNKIILGGSPAASLTSGVADPGNAGWLRLTNSSQFQKGFAYINSSFSSTLGILIDFEYKTWRNVAGEGGGDGFSVYLFNSTATFSLGGYGGSLGYSPDGPTPGLAGGYLGIGFDEFGNFSNPTQGRVGGPGLSPNSIVLRGPTTSNALTTNRYLTKATLNTSTNPIGYGTPVFNRPTDTEFYRRVKISIIPIGTASDPKYTISVMWRTTPTGNDVSLLTYDTVDPIPGNLKLGFAASSGGSVNFHEIRNLVITTPGGVRVDKSVDKLNARVGDKLTYKIDVYNATTTSIANLSLSDTLKTGAGNIVSSDIMEINSITFNNNGNTGNAATGFISGVPVTTGFTNPFNVNIIHMESNSMSTFTVVGTIKNTPIGGVLKNTVAIDASLTGITDQDLTNNISTATTTIPNTDFVIQNNFDDTCTDSINGNNITLLVSNIGSTTSIINNTVTVTDTLPAGFTVMSVSNTGWTVSNIGNIYRFTRNDLLTSTSTYTPITIKVKAPASGTIWVNSATVSYAGIEANTNNNSSSDTIYAKPVAPTVISPITYCQGESATSLSATGNNLLWYTTQNVKGSATAPIPDTSIPGNTIYYVNANNDVCESPLIPITVIVNPALTATIQGTYSVCKDSTATRILFTGSNGTAPYTFSYTINDGAEQTITTITGDTVSIGVSTIEPEIFTYNLKSVVDSKSCLFPQIGTAVVEVYICSVNITIPNAFTPNGDGLNDTFEPKTDGVENIKMDINDRNGRLVFTIDRVNGSWDGLMKSGEQAPVGVYFYKYEAKGSDKKMYSNQGSVSLFRDLINASVQITPNPVIGNAMVDLSRIKGTKTINIYNASGKQLKTWNTSNDLFDFDTSQFEKGLYILKVSGNQQISHVKFIKD